MVLDEASNEIIDSNKIFSKGSTAELKCKVKGHPVEPDFISWHSHPNVINWDKRSSVSFQNDVSVLKLVNVTQQDMGWFTCVVFNGIGAEKSAATFLIVERKKKFVLFTHILLRESEGGGWYWRSKTKPLQLFFLKKVMENYGKVEEIQLFFFDRRVWIIMEKFPSCYKRSYNFIKTLGKICSKILQNFLKVFSKFLVICVKFY